MSSSSRAANSETVERLARTGYAVKGILYGLVGILALLTALGEGGKTTGTEGAIRTLADAPFGSVLLWGVGLGLIAYALWRFVQAGLDPDGKGSDAEGIGKRVGLVGSGLIYAGLAVTTFRLLLGNGSGDSGGASSWTATLMEQPFGPWLVGLAGLVTLGVGGYQVYRAWTLKFAERLKTASMTQRGQRWAIGLSRFGIAARGLVFMLMGVFVLQAAITTDPENARGLDGALDALQQQSAGPYLLGLAALGLTAYGLYCLINARYRKIG